MGLLECISLLLVAVGHAAAANMPYLPRSTANTLRQTYQQLPTEKHIYFFSAPAEDIRTTRTRDAVRHLASTAVQGVNGNIRKQQLQQQQFVVIKAQENQGFANTETSRIVQNLRYQAALSRKYQQVSAAQNVLLPDATKTEVTYAEPRQQQQQSHAPDAVQQIQQAIVQRYGVKHTGSLNRDFLAPSASALASKNNYVGVVSSSPTILPPNSPVPKNYAQNFLPAGTDVIPGSSYIPLKKKK